MSNRTARLIPVLSLLLVLILSISACGTSAATTAAATTKAATTAGTTSAANTTSSTAATTAATTTAATTKAAPAYPTKDISLIIQSSPGGGSDLFARTFANSVQKNKLLPVNIAPENKPGGSGAVAYAFVANKAGDPYVILNASGTFITTPILGQGTDAAKINYTQFTMLGALAMDEMVIAVKADSKYQSLADLTADAKARPDRVIAGGTELGSPDSICYHLLEKQTGANFNYLVFDGADEANAALLGNNVNVVIGNPGDVMELYKAKKVRLLGTFSDKRLASLPDVPTVKEQGVDAVYQLTRGFAAPKNIPEEDRLTLEKAIQSYMKTAEWKSYVETNSLTEKFMTGPEFTKFIEQSTAMHTTILKEMGVIK